MTLFVLKRQNCATPFRNPGVSQFSLCNRRCRVRSWAALNRPGCCSSSQSIIVVAFSVPAGSPRSRGSISSSHTPSKESGRVRHRCSGFVADGNRPLCHFRAERTLIPAWAAASRVLPSIRFRLIGLTCRSVINGTSVPNDYPITTGKNSRRNRQDQLQLITNPRQSSP